VSSRLVLVDTSAFIEFSRDAGSSVAGAVDAALADGRAAVCQVVAAELLSGCRSTAEYQETALLLSSLEWLAVTDECWTRAAALGFNLRRSGLTVPLTDRLVVVIARLHGADLLHRDAHFDLIGDTPDEPR
jgi:predicted nucleic acid-binding protein